MGVGVMGAVAILELIKGQKERVTWALIALALLYWTWNTASDVGKLKAQVSYQEQALALMTKQLNECE